MNPVRRWLSGLCLAASLAIHISSLRAQIVNDGATNTLSNVTNFFAGNLTVGTNGSFTLLVLSDNATLTNSGFSTIGQNAKSNEVRLVSPTARWLMGASSANFLFIGSNGAANRLVVSNGATASVQANAYLGYISEAASNNQAWVTGSNSVWSSTATIEIGFLGSGNQVIVSNGGTVLATNTILGDGTIASNNLALVTGAGSLWSSPSLFYVGDDGSGNRLMVSEGGVVRSGFSRIGGALLSGSGNNLALITGSGSVWSNALDLEIGRSLGINNQLVVSNGASAFVGGNVLLGMSSGANANSVLVTDPGTSWLVGNNLYVGSNGALSRLVVSNGATVFSPVKGILGFNSTASSNAVIVTDPGSRWIGGLQSDFYIGSNGPLNQLIVTNGGVVADNDGFLGHGASSSSNLVLVSGAGSIWSNRFILEMGERGSGNRLVISNGGLVHASSFVRMGRITGTNNEAFVSGPGSLWNIPFGSLRIGESASRNRLEVNNGGSVQSRFAELGADVGSHNEAVVTGPGSLWTIAETIVVGGYGSRNRLVVGNAATVAAGTSLTLGRETIATNNAVIVDGGTMGVANTNGTAFVNILRGTNVLNAGLMDVDRLIVTNAQGFFEFNGGRLITRGAFISNNVPFTVGRGGTTPAIWDVRAGLTNHLVAGQLILGSNSPFNQLLVTNGATLDGTSVTFLAFNAASSNNAVTVTGPGSTLNSQTGVYVGANGSANGMTIGNGGKVFSSVGGAGSYIGLGVGTRSNAVTVADPGSRWSVNDFLHVGQGGNGNQLVVSNGALVDDIHGYVGSANSASNNLAIVASANSTWSNRSEFYVGASGSNNRLIVSDGGAVTQNIAYVGFSQSGRGNSALVSGAGALLTTFGNFFLGYDGRSNRLAVSQGGTVVSGNGYLGNSGLSGFNQVLVTDAGSVWSNRLDLHVGNECSFNVLVVSNQARVLDRYGFIGSGAVSGNNGVLVTGAGSLWSNSVDLLVGNGSTVGDDNWLLVTNGGAAVAAGNGVIGGTTGSHFNQATVADPLSRWEISGDLYVGALGFASLLSVTNAGTVVNSNGYVGFDVSGDVNFASISGAGSLWSNRQTLVVGQSSKGNLLVVSDGARVVSASGEIGSGTSASNNAVVVTGPGSVWTNGPSLLLGRSGSGNQLVISNGASVWSGVISMAVSAASSSNVAVVTGAGSVLNATLSLGSSGSSNRLFVSDGGVVQGVVSHIGPSSFNVAVISGAGSVWTNSSELLVGSLGSGNQLVVSNSGLVIARSSIFLGPNAGASSNGIEINGGALVVTNIGFGLFDIRRGTAVLNSGLIAADRLLLTNVGGFLQFSGGTLSVGNSRVSNGTLFQIGNGVSPATMVLAGNGLHEITSALAVTVSSNATLTGNGTIGGATALQLLAGSLLAPGTSAGRMVLSNSPFLRGAVVVEISKTGETLTNDQIQVIAPLTYGGSLVVSNLGPSALAAGDRFPLFNATSFSGGFTNIILPPLPAGLGWTNKLLVDGSLEVIEGPKFTSIGLSGANVILAGTNGPANSPYAVLTATNVATPLTNWVSIATSMFDPSGNFSFTNSMAPGISQRFFRIRTP